MLTIFVVDVESAVGSAAADLAGVECASVPVVALDQIPLCEVLRPHSLRIVVALPSTFIFARSLDFYLLCSSHGLLRR
jgi:hypothetical protein